MVNRFQIFDLPLGQKLAAGVDLRVELEGVGEEFKKVGIPEDGMVVVSLHKVHNSGPGQLFEGTTPYFRGDQILPPSVISGYLHQSGGYIEIRPSRYAQA